MTKPFGFYVSYTPGDNSFLESLQQTYGYDFCLISKSDKLLLISEIASHLSSESKAPTSGFEQLSELVKLGKQINNNLSVSDRAGLIEAMIAQVRWGQDLAVTEEELPMEQ